MKHSFDRAQVVAALAQTSFTKEALQIAMSEATARKWPALLVVSRTVSSEICFMVGLNSEAKGWYLTWTHSCGMELALKTSNSTLRQTLLYGWAPAISLGDDPFQLIGAQIELAV